MRTSPITGGTLCTNVRKVELEAWKLRARTWSCRRNVGNNAKDEMENNISAKTEMSSASLDARTTEAAMAAFIDRTEVNL